jgi:hypothetical protein
MSESWRDEPAGITTPPSEATFGPPTVMEMEALLFWMMTGSGSFTVPEMFGNCPEDVPLTSSGVAVLVLRAIAWERRAI